MAVLLTVALAALIAALLLRRVGSRERGLPPGPPTLPIIGNLHILPTKFPHYKFTEWARKYGGLYSLKVGPGTAIVLTDIAVVKELMDRRSGTTASRPPFYVAELVTGGLHFAFSPYNEIWKTLRQTAQAVLTPQASNRHRPIQQAEATQLLHDILESPESFYTHIQRYTCSVILSVIYGKRAPRYETPEATELFNALREWSVLLEFGGTPPVDLIPILKLVPERWAKWKQDCRRVRNLQRTLYSRLLDETTERLRRGEENGSYMEEVLAREQELGMDREMITHLGGTLIEGASDTTGDYIQSLVLALTAYPDAQRKAHDEIDRVIGEDRIPTLDDLEHMPYIRAMILETHRFRPVAPLMVPHATVAPEEYQGYIIPKDATIFINLWGIYHDPALYDAPEDFIPDRYLLTENGTKLGVDARDLRPNFAYGVGRRSCPGIHLAQNSINLAAMYLVWAFNFNVDIDADGNPVKPDTFAYKQGLASGPLPFKCKITPRTAEKARIIGREFSEARDTFSKFEFGLSPGDIKFVANSRHQVY
ncbi:cytochrome P450 [Mycena latifolia]|nr:cytochrome P450 [Mycena latifolia]